MPDTKVLANVYQLYIVLNQCASMLMSHIHGMVEPTVRPNNMTKNADQNKFLSIQAFAVSKSMVPIFSLSILRSLIFLPTNAHSPIHKTEATVYTVGFKNPDFPLSTSS